MTETMEAPKKERKPRDIGTVFVQMHVDVVESTDQCRDDRDSNGMRTTATFPAWRDVKSCADMTEAAAYIEKMAEVGRRYRIVRAKDPVEVKTETVRRIIG